MLSFLEKRLLVISIGSASIGSAAVAAATKSEANDEIREKNDAFVPTRLRHKRDDTIESITNDGIKMSLHLDNPNWEGESAEALLKNLVPGVEVDFSGYSNDEPTKNSSDIDTGILSDPVTISLPPDANMSELVPCAIEAQYRVTNHTCHENLLWNYCLGRDPCEPPSYQNITCPEELPYGPIRQWNVSAVTSFENAFRNACHCGRWNIEWNKLSKVIAKWDISSATSIAGLFANCEFDNIGGDCFGDYAPRVREWNVTNVEDMSFAFANSDFNRPLDRWKPRSIRNMTSMFYWNEYFDQNLTSWAAYLPQEVDISNMFTCTRDFDQCLSSWAPKNPILNDTFKLAARCTNKSDYGWCSCNKEKTQQLFLQTAVDIFLTPVYFQLLLNVGLATYLFRRICRKSTRMAIGLTNTLPRCVQVLKELISELDEQYTAEMRSSLEGTHFGIG